MPGGHEMTPTPMETTQDTGSDAGRFDEPGIPSNAPRMLVRVFFPRQGTRPSIHPFWQHSEKGPRQDQGASILHMANAGGDLKFDEEKISPNTALGRTL